MPLQWYNIKYCLFHIFTFTFLNNLDYVAYLSVGHIYHRHICTYSCVIFHKCSSSCSLCCCDAVNLPVVGRTKLLLSCLIRVFYCTLRIPRTEDGDVLGSTSCCKRLRFIASKQTDDPESSSSSSSDNYPRHAVAYQSRLFVPCSVGLSPTEPPFVPVPRTGRPEPSNPHRSRSAWSLSHVLCVVSLQSAASSLLSSSVFTASCSDSVSTVSLSPLKNLLNCWNMLKDVWWRISELSHR